MAKARVPYGTLEVPSVYDSESVLMAITLSTTISLLLKTDAGMVVEFVVRPLLASVCNEGGLPWLNTLTSWLAQYVV